MENLSIFSLPVTGLITDLSRKGRDSRHAAVNRSLISRAMKSLAPSFSDQILDLFCGLGNFSLPIATQGQSVVGVGGSQVT